MFIVVWCSLDTLFYFFSSWYFFFSSFVDYAFLGIQFLLWGCALYAFGGGRNVWNFVFRLRRYIIEGIHLIWGYCLPPRAYPHTGFSNFYYFFFPEAGDGGGSSFSSCFFDGGRYYFESGWIGKYWIAVEDSHVLVDAGRSLFGFLIVSFLFRDELSCHEEAWQ